MQTYAKSINLTFDPNPKSTKQATKESNSRVGPAAPYHATCHHHCFISGKLYAVNCRLQYLTDKSEFTHNPTLIGQNLLQRLSPSYVGEASMKASCRERDIIMVLLEDEATGSQNLAREMEMKMECDDLMASRRFRLNEDIKEGKRLRNEEMEEVVSGGWEEEEMREETGTDDVGVEEINDRDRIYSEELPPADDVCPICFDRFNVPCRSNCGHWFCASCILQFWMFRSSLQPCKCPLCCCQIVNLKPETSQLVEQPDDIVKVLKKVDQYNGLYVSGVLGAFHRILSLPLFMGRIFRVMIDPDGLRCVYYVMRFLGLVLALLYEKGEFEFVPTGGLGVQRMFDVGASVGILVLFFVGVGYRWVLSRRARRLAANQEWDS